MNQNKDNLITGVLEPFKSDAPLIIYIDLKSPYAYLSIEPTRHMLKDLGIVADWRPFVLDIPSYLGSAKLGKGGKKVAKQNRTEEQWSDVKYAYFDCRRYANLSEKTIRGTVKIWNTDLPAIGMLWLKGFSSLSEQCAEGSFLERFVDEIYDSFWKRELDAEDASVILAVLEKIGAPTEGFLKYAKTDGSALNNHLQESSFNAGIYGVPTYILPNESLTDPQHEKFFGRENLPRISWLLTGRKGHAPDLAYNLNSDIHEEVLSKSAFEPRSAPELKTSPKRLIAYFDFNSLHSYLALHSILSLKAEGISINWRPVSTMSLKEPQEETKDEDRSTKHRRLRAEYQVNDIHRYAPHDLTEIHRKTDCQIANLGFLWLQQELKMDSNVIDEYVESVFYHHWRDNGSITTIQDIESILLGIIKINSLDQELKWQDAWKEYCQSSGLEHLEIAQTKTKGINTTPTFLIGSEPFKGRAHLPLILARLKAGI
ncbi:MAG: hypothetical protein Ct9H300mP20_18090 [Gammaproteobacteria bacterium]|nr:MAG: hypothetical protein Ct9H300mP20_18090 [Gammaproteobacteria bacterium]